MKDVAIVGGGIAGLAAGWWLRHRDIALLESGARVGGRVRSERRGPYWLNWGGHVYAGGESATARLLTDTGVESVAVPGSLAGFVEHLVNEVRSLIVGEPGAGDDVEIGPLVSRPHFDRVRGFLDRARDAGLQAAVGGSALEGPGFFVAPTVLVNVNDDAEVAREEVFGPVVTVETFADEAEAVARANSVPYGLSASVWTENARRSHDIAARLDSGTVWVNAHLVLATEAPWGGFKGSGYGRDLSIYALDDYSRTKHVMHNHGR